MSFANTIISWFRENGRALPWRETKDPYAIWLSEIILQQTRIAQGWEYWERFMRQYPKVEDLAAASEDEVLKLWQGLGYYSRARNLHAAAKQIVALGKFPDTLDGIKALKGVGDYTAAAIGSFAFDIPAAVLDGNVYRVLARYFGIDTPINTTQGKKDFSALAQSLIPVSASSGASTPSLVLETIRPDAFDMALSPISAYNQGMMDFGAIQCTPQSPKCMLCPLAESCVALREGRVEELPVKQKTLKIKTLYLSYIYIRCKEGEEIWTAIRRRGKGDIWQGLWEPFNASLHPEKSAATIEEIIQSYPFLFSDEKAVKDEADAMDEIDAKRRFSLLSHGVKHVLTHRILMADFYQLDVSRRPHLPDGYVWVRESEMEQYGIPRLIEILLEKVRR